MEDQARKLLEALRGHDLEAIIALAIATGARRDELLMLKWRDVDPEKRELRIFNTKTKSGQRLTHLPKEIAEILKRHRIRQAEARVEAGAAWQDLDLVFPDRDGGVLEPGQPLKSFHEFLERAGLPPVSFHDLRAARWRELREQMRTTGQGT